MEKHMSLLFEALIVRPQALTQSCKHPAASCRLSCAAVKVGALVVMVMSSA